MDQNDIFHNLIISPSSSSSSSSSISSLLTGDVTSSVVSSSPGPGASGSRGLSSEFIETLSTLSFEDSAQLTVNTSDLETGWASSEPLLIPVTILYILILITGIVGNVSTCIVIIRNKYMRTATNYYLFSLAVSDLLLLICGLPQELYLLWRRRPYIFGEFFCIIRGLSSETSSNASVLTITAFTIERYLAICHPLKAHTMSKLSRVVKLIVFIWICALLGALPLALQFGLKYDDALINTTGQRTSIPIESTAECTVISPIKHSFVISTFIFFLIPCILLTVLYLSIGLHLRQSEALKRSQANQKCCCNWIKGRTDQLAHHHSPSTDPGETPLKHSASIHSTNSTTTNHLLTKSYHKSLLTKSTSIYSKFKPSLPSCIRYNSRSSANERHHLHHQNPHHPHHNHHHSHHHNYQSPQYHQHHESNSSSSSRRAVIKMLVAVVVAFFMCWAPFHAQRLMATYASGSTQAEIIIFNFLTYISGVTYYLSTTINPVLYSIMSIKFRTAFKETLGSCCHKSTCEPDLGKFNRGSRSSSRFNSTLKSTLGPESEVIIGPSDSFSNSFTRH